MAPIPKARPTTKMLNRGRPGTRQNSPQLLWIVPALILSGIVATVCVLAFASRFRSGGEVAVGVALLGIPAIVVTVLALRYAAGNALTFLSSSIRWWHLLWMLTFASALVFRVRSASDISSEPLDAWAIFRVAVDMVVAFVLLGRLALRRTHWIGSMFRGVLGLLTIFGLVEVISTVWSVFPTWTLYKSFEYLIDVALLAAILESLESTHEYRDLFNWTWALYGLLLTTVWIGVTAWPHDALNIGKFGNGLLGVRLEGILPAVSSNDVGTFAAIVGLLSLTRLFPASEEKFNTPWYLLLLFICLGTMVLSQTRTAIAGFLFGSLFILLYSRRGRLGAFVTVVLAPIVVLSTMGGLIWSFLERGQTEEQLATLSSRADWWSFAWQTYLERPLTGFGAYAAGRFAVLAKLGLGETSTLHSDYLDVLVGTGFWGMIPFILVMGATWWLLLRYVRDRNFSPHDHQLAFEGLAIFALLIFRSAFMTMLTWHPPLHFLVILGYVEFLRRRKWAVVQVEPPWLTAQSVDTSNPQFEYMPGSAGSAAPETTNPSY